jgi:hypothetical protein
MPDTIAADNWYAVYIVRGDEAVHAGHLHVKAQRNNGCRVLEQNIAINADVEHKARCVLTMERRGGRLVPLEEEYRDRAASTHLEFARGRLRADGSGRENDGDPCPDDVMPTYGVASLAKSIYNQPGASLAFTPMTDSNGDLGSHGSRLVCRGLTDKTPLPVDGEVWKVEWLSPEESVVQTFYFNDEGVVVLADWGGSYGVLAESERAAREPDSKALPISRKKR